MADNKRSIAEWEEESHLFIIDKSGLSNKLSRQEFEETIAQREFTGVDHAARRQYLKNHGYNDDKYLTKRTPEELRLPENE